MIFDENYSQFTFDFGAKAKHIVNKNLTNI